MVEVNKQSMNQQIVYKIIRDNNQIDQPVLYDLFLKKTGKKRDMTSRVSLSRILSKLESKNLIDKYEKAEDSDKLPTNVWKITE